MEMHTLDSLRRDHGIDVRPSPAKAQTSRLTYAGCRAMAGKARARVLGPAARLIGRALAADIRYLLRLADIGKSPDDR